MNVLQWWEVGARQVENKRVVPELFVVKLDGDVFLAAPTVEELEISSDEPALDTVTDRT